MLKHLRKTLLINITLLFFALATQAQEMQKKDLLGTWHVSKITFTDKTGKEVDEALEYEQDERTYTFKENNVTFTWHEMHSGKMKKTTAYSLKGNHLIMIGLENVFLHYDASKKILKFKKTSQDSDIVTTSTLKKHQN